MKTFVRVLVVAALLGAAFTAASAQAPQPAASVATEPPSPVGAWEGISRGNYAVRVQLSVEERDTALGGTIAMERTFNFLPVTPIENIVFDPKTRELRFSVRSSKPAATPAQYRLDLSGDGRQLEGTSNFGNYIYRVTLKRVGE
jgi:hypothetical protein